jgi:hypothetical protein
MSYDIEFADSENENFQQSLHEAMSGMYKDFKNQMNKLDNCKSLNITVMYDKYFLKKEQISPNLLMITISETPSVDLGTLQKMTNIFKQNFAEIDEVLVKIQAGQSD